MYENTFLIRVSTNELMPTPVMGPVTNVLCFKTNYVYSCLLPLKVSLASTSLDMAFVLQDTNIWAIILQLTPE